MEITNVLLLGVGLLVLGLALTAVSAWMHVRLAPSVLKDWGVAITHTPGGMLGLGGMWLIALSAGQYVFPRWGLDVKGDLRLALLFVSVLVATALYLPIQALFRAWIRYRAPGTEASWGRAFLGDFIERTRKL